MTGFSSAVSGRQPAMNQWRKSFFQYWDLYLLCVPAIAILFIFHYLPIYGVQIAFRNYRILDGISGSEWVGLEHFHKLFTMPKFYSVFTNTLLINLYNLVFQFPLPIILALMVNEVRNMKYKKFTQTITYLPHFLSWVVIGAIFMDLLSLSGIVNKFISLLGVEPRVFMADEGLFRSIVVTTVAWKETGWSSIVYLAAMTAVDPQLYEAAIIDGANRLQRTWHITLTGIRSTIIFIIMLRLSQALGSNAEQILMLYSPSVYSTGDVLSTYVYRTGLGQMKYSFTSAVGLFQSVVGMSLLIICNSAAKRFGERGLW